LSVILPNAKRRESQIMEVLEITRSFQLTPSMEKFLERCIQGASNLIHPKSYSLIWILLKDRETSELRLHASQNPSREADWLKRIMTIA